MSLFFSAEMSRIFSFLHIHQNWITYQHLSCNYGPGLGTMATLSTEAQQYLVSDISNYTRYRGNYGIYIYTYANFKALDIRVTNSKTPQ